MTPGFVQVVATRGCVAVSFNWRGASCVSEVKAPWRRYRGRTEDAAGKRKRTMIVALARKLLIALVATEK